MFFNHAQLNGVKVYFQPMLEDDKMIAMKDHCFMGEKAYFLFLWYGQQYDSAMKFLEDRAKSRFNWYLEQKYLETLNDLGLSEVTFIPHAFIEGGKEGLDEAFGIDS